MVKRCKLCQNKVNAGFDYYDNEDVEMVDGDEV